MGDELEQLVERLDESTWNANTALSACTTAADYRSICAGERTVGEPGERQHWALPHHYLGKEANAAGVRAGRQRFGQATGLKDREKARTHLFVTHALPTDAGRSIEELELEAAVQARTNGRPPRDGLVRAIAPGEVLLRAADDDDPDAAPVMFGHFSVFDEWTEIDSFFEGHFMERIADGSFTKTFDEGGQKVLFNHGQDRELGDKVLGTPTLLAEDRIGAKYEVELFPSVPPLVMDGLRAKAYGASFRFRVLREEFNREPGKSKHNPEGIPERTIKEVDVMEFGPVTFPAYAGATAGVRSLTDEVFFGRLTDDPAKLRAIIDYARELASSSRSDEDELEDEVDEATEQEVVQTHDDDQAEDDAPSSTPGDEPTSSERREPVPLYGQEEADRPSWML